MSEKDPAKMTYTEAVTELEEIVRQMQSENCNIDNLSALTSRSLQLLTICKAKLQTTDEELKKLLATIEKQQ